MRFKAKRMHEELSKAAAEKHGFPQNVVDWEFPNGLPTPDWDGIEPITSASYIKQGANTDLVSLGKIAKDPYRIDQIPYLSQLVVTLKKNEKIAGKKNHALFVQRSAYR